MRLFVAVNFPAELREAVWAAVAPARRGGEAVRWVRPENIHLTLKFLGEVTEERTAALPAALGRAAAGTRAFDVTVGGGGAFPDQQRPRIFWIGVTPEPALELLQHAVEREFAPLGFPTEGRPFHPHLTLGRAERSAAGRDLQRAVARLLAVGYEGTARIEAIDLMQSTTRPSGTIYEAVHRERLG